MCEIYIYGAGDRGAELFERLQEFYVDKITIVGFIDSYVKGSKCSLPIYSVEEVSKDSTIVISVFKFDVALQIFTDLKKKGYSRIYWYDIWNMRENRIDFFKEQCIPCNDWSKNTLLHVEMHAMDACNLNCVGCTHFSPIFADKKKPDTESRIKDIDLLKKKIKSVARFYILGGEPFLNDDIAMYTDKVKQLYPNASITIVTNGLLIPKLPQDLLEYLGQEGICVSISEYEPTHCILEQIKETLNRYNIVYHIRNSQKFFNIPLSLEPIKVPYCISPGCITLARGEVACCPTLMYIEDLNKRFGFKFPSEGRISLTLDVSEGELKKMLEQRVPLCQFCVKNEIGWRTCGGLVQAEHFVKMDEGHGR